MNPTLFTVEEENLICIFYTNHRNALINSIFETIPYLDEPDLRETAENSIYKLEAMSDEEFSQITFHPAFDGDDEGEV